MRLCAFLPLLQQKTRLWRRRVPQPRSCDSLEAQAAGVSASRGPLQNAARRARRCRCRCRASSPNPRGRAAAAAAQTAVRTDRASRVLACLRRRPLQPEASSGSPERPPLRRDCGSLCCRHHQTFFPRSHHLGLDASSILNSAADPLRKRAQADRRVFSLPLSCNPLPTRSELQSGRTQNQVSFQGFGKSDHQWPRDN